MDIIKREYFIPNLRHKIEVCRANCIPCILSQRKAGKAEGFLNPIDKNEAPLSTYHIDHLGPMTATAKMYAHILCVVDGFTKFCWIHPVKTTSTAEVLQKLNLQRAVFGNPARIISDRGSAFTSNAFRDYCEENQIEHVLITTGVPRANGQVERINRIIISVLSKLSIANPSKWYTYTNQLQMFLNSTWQRSIKRTPFELLIGTKIRLGSDVALAELVNDEIKNAFDAERDRVREEARANIRKVQEENKKTYNHKRNAARKYSIGDLVAIRRTQFGANLKIAAL